MEQAWSPIWLLIRSWLTSATLFLLLNFIIGFIALTSKSLSQRRQNDSAPGDGNAIVCTASCALHRMRSLSLTRLRSGEFFFKAVTTTAAHPKSEEIATASPKKEVAEKGVEHVFCGSHSEEKGVESSVMMMKSASERSVRGSFEKKKAVGEEVKGEVDARADDFINKFRHQLRLQRLDSLRK